MEHHPVGNVIKGMAGRRPHTGSAYSKNRGLRKTLRGAMVRVGRLRGRRERAPMMREGGPRKTSIILKNGTWIIFCNISNSCMARPDYSYFTDKRTGTQRGKVT